MLAPAKGMLHRLLTELREDGYDPSSEQAEPVVSFWMNQAAPDSACRCGKMPLARWEYLNGKCQRCMEAELRSIERIEQSRHRSSDPMTVCNIPAAYHEYTLMRWSGAVEDTLLRWAKDRKDPRTFAVLSGSTGVGKTHLAMILLMEAFKVGLHGYYVNARLLPPLLMDDSRVEEHPLWAKISRVPFLLIDDVGAEADRDFAADKIASLIEDRYLNRRKTIVTTNLTLTEIYSKDARIGSRLSEGIDHVVQGKDWRIQ